MACKVRKVIPVILFFYCSFYFNIVLAQEDMHRLEVVFITKLANFVDWKGNSGINELNKPFLITVIGTSEIDNYLVEMFIDEAEKIRSKKVELRFISEPNKISDCNILFIASSEKRNLKEILNRVKNKSILTISDTPGFAEQGSIINFYMSDDNKLRFEINYKKSIESKITINSRLLRIAKVVE